MSKPNPFAVLGHSDDDDSDGNDATKDTNNNTGPTSRPAPAATTRSAPPTDPARSAWANARAQRESRVQPPSTVLPMMVQRSPLRDSDKVQQHYQYSSDLVLPPTVSELKVVTLNVNMNSEYLLPRMSKLIELLDTTRPHIVALQEVTRQFVRLLRIFMDHYGILDYYDAVPSRRILFGSYGTMFLVRSDNKHGLVSREIELTSDMNRTMLVVELGEDIAFATVHLESYQSPKSKDIRAQQLAECEEALQRYSDVLIMGDFNMEEDEPCALPGFVDAWKSLRGDDEGYTYDCQCNFWSNPKKRDRRARYDRVLCRLNSTPQWSPPTSIQLFADKPIGITRDELPLFVSDHFGLFVTLHREPTMNEPPSDLWTKYCPDPYMPIRYLQSVPGHETNIVSVLETVDAFTARVRPSDLAIGLNALWIYVFANDKKVDKEDSDDGDGDDRDKVRAVRREFNELIANGLRPPDQSDVIAMAKRHKILSGKWLYFGPQHSVDSDWCTIAKAVVEGNLGPSARVSTLAPEGRVDSNGLWCVFVGEKKSPVICVYTRDFTDEQDVYRVQDALKAMGLKGRLHYKADVFTILQLDARNEWGIDVVMYSGRR